LSLVHIFVLAVIQGITEFLPISSSGHLAIIPWFVKWPDQGIVFDIAVHIGTLLAVIIYFWKDLTNIVCSIMGIKIFSGLNGIAMLSRVAVTIPPVFIAGAIVAWKDPSFIRTIEIIAITTISFGVLLWLADKYNLSAKKIEKTSITKILIIGLFQAIAVIPGTSRSGITITAARMMGIERTEAAKFSMLISIPVIIGAGSVAGFKWAITEQTFSIHEAGLAVLISFITALLSITALMKLVKIIHYGPFALYRIIVGVALLVWIYFFDTIGLQTITN